MPHLQRRQQEDPHLRRGRPSPASAQSPILRKRCACHASGRTFLLTDSHRDQAGEDRAKVTLADS